MKEFVSREFRWQKSLWVAYFWLFLTGFVGGHKLYLGNRNVALKYALTLGFGGLGFLYDIFSLPKQLKRANNLLKARMESKSSLDASAESSEEIDEEIMDSVYSYIAAEARYRREQTKDRPNLAQKRQINDA
ncbi:TM2 domain-containing protein [Methylobacterium sp. P31]